MKIFARIISLLVVLSMLFSFAACNKDDKEKEGTDKTTAANADGGNEDSDAQNNDDSGEPTKEGETTAAKDGTATTKSSGTATTKSSGTATTAAKTTAVASSVKSYKTISEILAFYKASANPLKSSKTAVATRTKERITTISGSIPSMYQTFGFKEGDNNEQVKVGAGQDDTMEKKFPVEKKTYVCDLAATDIKSATCTYSGGVYTVTINVKDDNAGTYSRSSKCVSTISVPIGTWTCKGVKVQATIKDGKLQKLYYSMPTYVTSGGDAFAFNLEQWWTVNRQ